MHAAAVIANSAGTVEWGIRYYNDAGGFTTVTGNVSETGTYYDSVQLEDYRHATNGALRLWVNNVLEIEVTGINNTARTMNYTQFGVTTSGTMSQGCTLTMDDCTLSTEKIDSSQHGEDPPETIILFIESPANTTYTSHSINFTMYATGDNIDMLWYEVLSGTTSLYGNITYIASVQVGGLANGTYTAKAYANNTANVVNYTTIMFSIAVYDTTLTAVIAKINGVDLADIVKINGIPIDELIKIMDVGE